MRIKTTELATDALDWAVAKCEGVVLPYGLTNDERYSTDWSQGGPIIEREWHAICTQALKLALANVPEPKPLLRLWMICFVASRLGDEVDVPDELVHV